MLTYIFDQKYKLFMQQPSPTSRFVERKSTTNVYIVSTVYFHSNDAQL